jgi:hypothetical protein
LPVPEAAEAAGGAQRAVRLDGQVRAVADVGDDLLGEVRGVDRHLRPSAQAEAADPGQRAIQQGDVADRAERLG